MSPSSPAAEPRTPSSPRRPRRTRSWLTWAFRWSTLATTALGVYWLMLVAGTHVPGHASGPPQYNDKLAHFVGYAGLAFLISWAWATRWPFGMGRVMTVWTICALHGALDELTQIPIPGRSGEWRDWLADACGAALGLGAFCLSRQIVRIVGRRFRPAAVDNEHERRVIVPAGDATIESRTATGQ